MNIGADATTLELNGVEETRKLGRALAEALQPGDVVALTGELGAGKTELVRTVAAALGADERDVASPTFVCLHIYEARIPVYHFDAYRLGSTEEFLDLGARDFFESEGVAFVEWAERVADALPPRRLNIHLSHAGGATRRRAQLRGLGDWQREIRLPQPEK